LIISIAILVLPVPVSKTTIPFSVLDFNALAITSC